MNPSLLRSLVLSVVFAAAASGVRAADFNVKAFGATGDGKTLDTDAVNKAIDAANAAGGGTVVFGPGTYACYSIHLKSNVTLDIETGATLMAAVPSADGSQGYDLPEANEWQPYEDYGHSHWHNSLIWGEHVENVAIVGLGRIYGYGLSRGAAAVLRDTTPDEKAQGITAQSAPPRPEVPAKTPFGYPGRDTLANGVGNKSISLKECHNVTLRDVTIFHGGHFGILATGVDNFTIDNLKIDTNRDGMDIDSCRNVHVSNCSVNSPNDDGICLKSDYALGYKRGCENITITNCHVSGFLEGSFLDASYKHWNGRNGEDTGGGTGRIKLGTESNGGYQNVVISNCTFNYCRGLALEEVDGGSLEDVSITNLTMRDIENSAIYIRLGERNRGPESDTKSGIVRRVSISHVVAQGVDGRYASIIAGTPGHDIEDLTLSDIRIEYKGGGTAEQAAIVPKDLEKGYPEPSNHGVMPGYGFFVRHVKGISMRDIYLGYATPDARPAIVLDQVKDAYFDHVVAQHGDAVPVFSNKNVSNFTVLNSPGATQPTGQ